MAASLALNWSIRRTLNCAAPLSCSGGRPPVARENSDTLGAADPALPPVAPDPAAPAPGSIDLWQSTGAPAGSSAHPTATPSAADPALPPVPPNPSAPAPGSIDWWQSTG